MEPVDTSATVFRYYYQMAVDVPARFRQVVQAGQRRASCLYVGGKGFGSHLLLFCCDISFVRVQFSAGGGGLVDTYKTRI